MDGLVGHVMDKVLELEGMSKRLEAIEIQLVKKVQMLPEILITVFIKIIDY